MRKQIAYAKGVPSPAAKKIISEKDLNTEELVGSGKGGRITKQDVLNIEKTTAQKTDKKPIKRTTKRKWPS